MPACVSCGADILPDSQFCEVCGHKVGEPAATKASPPEKAGPGSLRSEIAFLAGAVDQAKVRIENWRHKGDQAKLQAEREANIQRIDKEQVKKEERKKRGPLQTLMQVLVGLISLAAFVYLLIKMPRKTSPYAMMFLYKEMLQTIQEEFGEFMGEDLV